MSRTPPARARELGVTPEKIINFIRAGELHAVNAAAPGATRPRYVITDEAWAEFLQRRAVHPDAKAPKRRPKREPYHHYV